MDVNARHICSHLQKDGIRNRPKLVSELCTSLVAGDDYPVEGGVFGDSY